MPFRQRSGHTIPYVQKNSASYSGRSHHGGKERRLVPYKKSRTILCMIVKRQAAACVERPPVRYRLFVSFLLREKKKKSVVAEMMTYIWGIERPLSPFSFRLRKCFELFAVVAVCLFGEGTAH